MKTKLKYKTPNNMSFINILNDKIQTQKLTYTLQFLIEILRMNE